MTVPSVRSRRVPRLPGGLLAVRVHSDVAGIFSTRVGGLATVNGTRTPSAHGKAGLAFTAGLAAAVGVCGNDETVTNAVARTTANDNEAVLRVFIGAILFRSEERRVGKECRSRWS